MAFDPQVATAAYIDTIGPEALAKAAAYTAGSHWLILWNLVVGVIVAVLVIRSRLLERVERRLERRAPNLRALSVGVVYFIFASVLSLPWSMYEEWWRERSYGRSSQPFGDALMLLMDGSYFTRLVFPGASGPVSSLMSAVHALIEAQLH